MSIEPINPAAPLPRWVQLLAPTRQLAEVLSKSDFVPKAFRDNPDAIAAAILYGDELGVDPMMALQSIDVVEGKPRPSAQLARGLILQAGHAFQVLEMTGTRCRVRGKRKDAPEAEALVVEWTIEQARAAGLANRPNWRSYPRAMLAARATSDLANLLFPDVMKGLTWVSEEAASLEASEAWAPRESAPEAPALPRPQRRAARPSLPSPGHTHATEDKPGPDGSWDQPIPETVAPGVSNDPEPIAVDLPPEIPAPGSDPDGEPAEPKLIGAGQMRLMRALLKQALGTSASSAEQRQLISGIIRREVASARDLLTSEASDVIDVLGKVADGRLALDLGPGGWAVIVPEPEDHTTPEPPTEDTWGAVMTETAPSFMSTEQARRIACLEAAVRLCGGRGVQWPTVIYTARWLYDGEARS